MLENLLQYHTYILRFWQERNTTQRSARWRFTLEDPTNDIRHGFNSLDEITTFLQGEVKRDRDIRDSSPSL